MTIKVVFGVDHTKHGCTVWRQMPNGNRYQARFKNTCYVAALTKAEQWVWDQRQFLLSEAELSKQVFEFEVPAELDRVTTRKTIALRVELWAAAEAQAKAERVGLSTWVGEAIKARLATGASNVADGGV